jgi:hypothetical protein
VTKIQGNEKVEALFDDYSKAKKSLVNNKNVNSLIDNPNFFNNAKSPELSEKLCTEYLFYDYLVELYPPTNESKILADFFKKLKELYKDVLGQEIQIGDKVEQLGKSEVAKPFQRVVANQVLETEPSRIEPRKPYADVPYTNSRMTSSPKRGDTKFDEYDHSLEQINEVFDIKYESNKKSNKNSKPPLRDFGPSPIIPKGRNPQSKFVNTSPQFRDDQYEVDELSREDDDFGNEVFSRKPTPKLEPLAKTRQESKFKDQPKNEDPNNQKKNLNDEIDLLYKEKLDLTQEINDLAIKKKKFERKVQNAEKNLNQSKFETSFQSIYKQGNSNGGDVNNLSVIKKNKDLQINDLSKKIARLEGHFKEPDAYSNPVSDLRKSKFNTPSKVLPSQSFINESKSFAKTSTIQSLGGGSRYRPNEGSGTSFVNQMFNDIDRALNRGAPKYQTQNLTQSFYQYY